MVISKKLSLPIFMFSSVVLIACSPQTRSAQFSFEQASSQIRYENVDPQGQFIESQFVLDPNREQYFRGEWTKATTKVNIAAVQSTSNSSNRVHVVFLGDGYTSAELNEYAQDVNLNIRRFLSQPPFDAYQNYFAFHKVDVVSSVSGVSIAGSSSKSTALEMQYGCNQIDRLLCINANKASAAAASAAPKVDIIFAMANSDKYGGAGYMSPAIATLAAKNPNTLELAMHEFGHSFGKLTDEYDSAGVPSNCKTFANTATVDRTSMLTQKTKWFRWLDLSNVGSFQGSCYSNKYYRPTQNSKMRSLGMAYDPINTEQLIFRIYEKVRPIEFATPPGVLKNHQIIRIGVLQQTETPLEINWSLDGKSLPKYQGKMEINTQDLGLKKGTLTVKVTDVTKRVRDEEQRKKLMTQSLNWQFSF